MKNAHSIIAVFVFLMLFLGVRPLEAQTKNGKKTKNALLLKNKEAASEDEKEVQEIADYEQIRPIPGFFRDSVQVLLRDFKTSSRIDSLWVLELTNSELYPRMKESLEKVPDANSDTLVDRKELPVALLKERLAYLDTRTPLNIQYTPELERMIHNYLRRDKELMERLMALSEYYFPLFEEELAKRDIPMEIKYLPIIESALNPLARSRVGATGLWQFMFATGKMHGLAVNSYMDERMDPLKSTRAAVTYLGSLYEIFEDWDMVLAAYNAGPGKVSRAIRRSGGETDYWKLKRYLPRETANYVPAFLAVYYVFHYADEHGFAPARPDIPYFYTDTVHVKDKLKFSEIAETIGTDEDLIAFLNPSYKLKIIPKNDEKQQVLRLPLKDAGLFAANEGTIYEYTRKDFLEGEKEEEDVPESIEYRVRSGDILGRIANRYGVTVTNLKQWNNLYSNRLSIGQVLVIYPGPKAGTTGSTAQSAPKTNQTEPSGKIYVVQKGDSLWTISRKFKNVTISQIREWNDIRGNRLKPGMKLKISEG